MQLGIYKHYKGSLVEAIGIALHSETLEKMVVYKKLEAHNGHPAGTLWVRPLTMFQETVKIDGKEIPRFALVETA
jgi:hypothetical protein